MVLFGSPTNTISTAAVATGYLVLEVNRDNSNQQVSF